MAPKGNVVVDYGLFLKNRGVILCSGRDVCYVCVCGKGEERIETLDSQDR